VRRLLPRLGFAAAAILYTAIGVTAARVAVLGARDRTAGVPAALSLILRQPGGRLLLGAVAAGMAAFAVWHLLEVRRPRRSLLRRLGHAAAAVGYGALAWSAAALLLRLSGTGGAVQRSALEWLLSSRTGRIAVEAAGWLTVAGGLSEVWQGFTGRLANRFATAWLSRDSARFARTAARVGLSSRGIVVLLLGIFQVRLARGLGPRRLSEIGGALHVLSGAPHFGPLLSGAVSVGLIVYGAYMAVLAVAWRPRQASGAVT
jgi:hypothetical protein